MGWYVINFMILNKLSIQNHDLASHLGSVKKFKQKMPLSLFLPWGPNRMNQPLFLHYVKISNNISSHYVLHQCGSPHHVTVCMCVCGMTCKGLHRLGWEVFKAIMWHLVLVGYFLPLAHQHLVGSGLKIKLHFRFIWSMCVILVLSFFIFIRMGIKVKTTSVYRKL